METPQILTSCCRCCQHYTPEGRRGGHCAQLHVPVKGGWTACSLAIPAFSMSWEEAHEMITLPPKTPASLAEIPVAALT